MTPGGWDCGHVQTSAECDVTPNPNLVCGNALLTRDARSLSRDRLILLAWLLVEGRPEEQV